MGFLYKKNLRIFLIRWKNYQIKYGKKKRHV